MLTRDPSSVQSPVAEARTEAIAGPNPNVERMTTNLPRLLLVWDYLPAKNSGAGIILWRLLQGYPSDRLWALAPAPALRSARGYEPLPATPRVETVPRLELHRRFAEFVMPLLRTLSVPWIIRRGVRLVRRHGIRAVLTLPWSEYFLAAWWIHRRTGCDLYVYVMDDPLGAVRNSFVRSLLAPFYDVMLPRILRAAKHVWAIGPQMSASLEQRFGVSSTPLPAFVDVGAFRSRVGERTARERRGDSAVRIAYVGAIYTLQLDALASLVRVLNSGQLNSSGLRFELDLYTWLSPAALAKMKLTGPGIRRLQVTPEEMPGALAQADILFLPYSFDPAMRHTAATSLPTKLAEYLASGVPILTFAPAESSVAQYCRQHQCALVVDQDDPEALARALVRLATDQPLRTELSRNAVAAAWKNHDQTASIELFYRALA